LRIISLVPSLTSTLIDLGVADLVVGRTVYCPAVPGAAVVGGTKDPAADVIQDLRPDVVLAVKEENPRALVLELSAAGVSVQIYDPLSVGDAIELARDLGALTGADRAGEEMAREIEVEAERARESAAHRSAISTVYLVWREPYMAAGPRTYIADLLRTCGLPDVLPKDEDRYPTATLDDLLDLSAGLFLFASEPFPFNSEHVDEFRAAAGFSAGAAPATLRCRGDLVGWYPGRTAAALRHLTELAQAVARSRPDER